MLKNTKVYSKGSAEKVFSKAFVWPLVFRVCPFTQDWSSRIGIVRYEWTPDGGKGELWWFIYIVNDSMFVRLPSANDIRATHGISIGI